MYLKCFFVLFATVFMPGLICAHVPDGAVPRYRQFSTFNGVEIKGVVDVDLHTGDNNPRLVLQGSQ